MSFSSRAAAVLAAVVAASLGVPPATAGEGRLSRLVLEDSAGDVWQLPADEEEVQVELPTADVVGAVAVHGRHRIKVTATFTDLQQVDSQGYSVQLITDSRRTWDFTVSTNAENWDGRLQTWSYGEGGEQEGQCEAAIHRVDYATESVSTLIPRTCVRRPGWVRVLISNDLSQESVPSQATHYWDNPHNSSMEGASPTRRLFRAPDPGSAGTPAPYRVELTDPAGDVWSDGPPPVLATDTPAADVLRAVLAHQPHRLAIQLQFAALAAGDRQAYEAWVFTGADAFLVWLDVSPRHPGGVLKVFSYSSGRVDCEGARFAVDYDADRVAMTVPRNCLGKPQWVRMQLINYLVRPAAGSEPEIYTDNPHNAQPDAYRPTPRLYVEVRS